MCASVCFPLFTNPLHAARRAMAAARHCPRGQQQILLPPIKTKIILFPLFRSLSFVFSGRHGEKEALGYPHYDAHNRPGVGRGIPEKPANAPQGEPLWVILGPPCVRKCAQENTATDLIESKMWPLCKQGMAGSMDGPPSPGHPWICRWPRTYPHLTVGEDTITV